MPPFDIAILTTGDELLSGEISDSNTRTVAEILSTYGYRLRCSLSVPDQEKEIVAALQYLMSHVQFIIVTGGLGSTGDDRTARAAARALGQPLVVNDVALELIREWFAQRNFSMEPNNERQALLPQLAQPLKNPLGTAPGFRLQHRNGCELFFLPGVPAEMQAMFKQSVFPVLQQKMPNVSPRQQRTFKLFGLSEPKIDQLIPYQQLPAGVDVAFALDFPLVLLKLKATGKDAASSLDQAEALVLNKLGDYVIAKNGETPEGNVSKLLSNAGLTLSLAESCTGGLLSAMLTSQPGASAFLERAGVTYADSAKQDWLNVPALLLQQHGAVSENCARAMASGLRQNTRTDLSLAITGIAGPGGGTAEKPVGTVFISLASASGVHVKRYTFSGDRNQIQRMSATMALEWLRRFTLQQMEK
ncbi:competence/damage-inducible protein cinA [Desulfuromusa kysingii]|uniref:CinA-like protein n=1 Tax=Desulfuromusa kysingii TaxID=37625 RepID=A0A1H3VZI4_9BACT|nr:CinA family nicotinamide mononucleotide deamidase-related protein [Desulfuromusa kysingii]SDZ79614.1 competence/damage-inducible protein cinA [Desulfuromusa kysingii]